MLRVWPWGLSSFWSWTNKQWHEETKRPRGGSHLSLPITRWFCFLESSFQAPLLLNCPCSHGQWWLQLTGVYVHHWPLKYIPSICSCVYPQHYKYSEAKTEFDPFVTKWASLSEGSISSPVYCSSNLQVWNRWSQLWEILLGYESGSNQKSIFRLKNRMKLIMQWLHGWKEQRSQQGWRSDKSLSLLGWRDKGRKCWDWSPGVGSFCSPGS